MKMKINTDGGFSKHLGAACSYIISCNGNAIFTCSYSAPKYTTNNQAEYGALLAALKHITDTYSPGSIESVEHISDSQLLVSHFNDKYNVKEPELIAMMKEIKAYSTLVLSDKVTSTHVKRHLNNDADWLCNIILDTF